MSVSLPLVYPLGLSFSAFLKFCLSNIYNQALILCSRFSFPENPQFVFYKCNLGTNRIGLHRSYIQLSAVWECQASRQHRRTERIDFDSHEQAGMTLHHISTFQIHFTDQSKSKRVNEHATRRSLLLLT